MDSERPKNDVVYPSEKLLGIINNLDARFESVSEHEAYVFVDLDAVNNLEELIEEENDSDIGAKNGIDWDIEGNIFWNDISPICIDLYFNAQQQTWVACHPEDSLANTFSSEDPYVAIVLALNYMSSHVSKALEVMRVAAEDAHGDTFEDYVFESAFTTNKEWSVYLYTGQTGL